MSTGAIAEKEYRINNEQCQSMISGVCSCCGGELVPIETVDNGDNPTYWAGCESCNRFDWGVDAEVFQIAKYMVEKRNYVHYSLIDRPGSKNWHDEAYTEYYNRSQIAGACTFIAEIFRIQNQLKNEQSKL